MPAIVVLRLYESSAKNYTPASSPKAAFSDHDIPRHLLLETILNNQHPYQDYIKNKTENHLLQRALEGLPKSLGIKLLYSKISQIIITRDSLIWTGSPFLHKPSYRFNDVFGQNIIKENIETPDLAYRLSKNPFYIQLAARPQNSPAHAKIALERRLQEDTYVLNDHLRQNGLKGKKCIILNAQTTLPS